MSIIFLHKVTYVHFNKDAVDYTILCIILMICKPEEIRIYYVYVFDIFFHGFCPTKHFYMVIIKCCIT